ncbi:hypothetical protein [Labrys neptuniae]
MTSLNRTDSGIQAGRAPLAQPLALIAVVLVLSFFFANVEIQIEGSHGWATSLPTWRIEHHWLLDIFWGSRPMTGYHAWVFPFMAIFFHFPLVFAWTWSWRLEARVIACIMMFWLSEDFLWFVLNPAFGLARFSPEFVPWHIHWFWLAPVDYWTMSTAGILLMIWSYRGSGRLFPKA